MQQYRRGVTLFELIIAIVLLGLMVVGLGSIELFSHFQTIDADRRATLQNDVSYILEFIAKDIVRAVGNLAGDSPIERYTSNGERIKICMDTNINGQKDTNDFWSAYWFFDDTYNPATDRYQLRYCSQCKNEPCNQCDFDWDVLSTRISNFSFQYSSDNNWVEIELTGCWDPDGAPNACGTPMNPEVTMTTRASMPSVSAR